MTEMDRPAFAEALHVLAETFGEAMSDIRAEAYFDALRDLPLEKVNAAVRGAVRHSRFFPKPVELREQVEGNPADNADVAWGELMQQVQRVGYMGTPTFSDDRTMEAIRQVWGGWRRLCETLPAEGPELVGWIKQFKATYQTVDRRNIQRQITKADLHPDVRKFIAQKALIHAFPSDKKS